MKVNRKRCALHDSDEPQVIWKNVSGVGKVCKSCFLKKCAVSKPSKPRKAIAPRSSKRIELDKEYSVLRKEFLEKNPMCEAHLQGCLGKANQVHHRAGKVGALYTDVTNFLAICGPCHSYITEHSKFAIEKGLSDSRK